MSEFELLKKVARSIRYRELSQLKGTTIQIDDWGSIETLLIDFVQEHINDEQITQFKPSSPIAFLKYGLLDIEFTVSNTVIGDNYLQGVRLLHEFGWLGTDVVEDDDEISFLTMLVEDIERDSMFLRFYLKAQETIPLYESEFAYSDVIDSDGAQAVMEILDYLEKPTYDFPNRFKLTGAFLTNVSNFGLWKHFYL